VSSPARKTLFCEWFQHKGANQVEKQIVCKDDFLSILKQSKLSCRELAKVSGVRQSTIEKWVYCGAQMSLENAIIVLAALGYKLTIEEGL
jgi:hypothetical protein